MGPGDQLQEQPRKPASRSGADTLRPKVSIEERMELHDVIARYAWALDTGDVEGYWRGKNVPWKGDGRAWTKGG
jgi:hypothetical protein